MIFEFLEQYLQRLEGPVAIQVWGRFFQLAKEIISGTRDSKSQIFPALRSVICTASLSSCEVHLFL